MSDKPLLVLVTGPPGAGKTTVARQLASLLGFPLITKDDIKESLSDSLGKTSLPWSRRLGGATWNVMFMLVERFIADGVPVVFESNFYPERQRGWFEDLASRHAFVPIEFHCTADPATLLARRKSRPRHPVHHEMGDSSRDVVTNGPLELGSLTVLDTSDGAPVDVASLIQGLRRSI